MNTKTDHKGRQPARASSSTSTARCSTRRPAHARTAAAVRRARAPGLHVLLASGAARARSVGVHRRRSASTARRSRSTARSRSSCTDGAIARSAGTPLRRDVAATCSRSRARTGSRSAGSRSTAGACRAGPGAVEEAGLDRRAADRRPRAARRRRRAAQADVHRARAGPRGGARCTPCATGSRAERQRAVLAPALPRGHRAPGSTRRARREAAAPRSDWRRRARRDRRRRRTTSACCARPASASRWATRDRRCSPSPTASRARTRSDGVGRRDRALLAARESASPPEGRRAWRRSAPARGAGGRRRSRTASSRTRRRTRSAGVSLFEAGVVADAEYGRQLRLGPDGGRRRAVNLLADAGFEVLQATSLMINFAGAARCSRRRSLRRSSPRSGRSSRPGREERRRSSTAGGHRRPRARRHGGHALRGSARGRRDRGAGVPGDADVVPAAGGVLPSRRARRRVARLQRRQGASRWHDRARRQRRDGRHGLAAHPWFTDRGYRVDPTSARPGDRRTRASTRTATAPASRRTSSPRRRTARSRRSRRPQRRATRQHDRRVQRRGGAAARHHHQQLDVGHPERPAERGAAGARRRRRGRRGRRASSSCSRPATGTGASPASTRT